MTRRAIVRVPASTANLGAGFDCAGVALDRWLTVTATLGDHGSAPRVDREGTLAALSVLDRDDRIVLGFNAACARVGRLVPRGVTLRASSTIPVARGLGSSAAAAVAGAVAANALLRLSLDDAAIIASASSIEGHADNVCAAVYGGAVLALPGPNGAIRPAPIRVSPTIAFVLAIPEVEIETRRARAALPRDVPHATAVRAAALAAALVQGLISGEGDLLASALDDVLHVPYRRAQIPSYDDVTGAAVGAGAFGATISGSGSSILALASRANAMRVAVAMLTVWQTAGIRAESFVGAGDVPGYDVQITTKSVTRNTGQRETPTLREQSCST